MVWLEGAMCWSLAASVSALAAALVASVWTIVYLRAVEEQPDSSLTRADAESAAAICAFSILVGLVQLVDAYAHANARAGQAVVSEDLVGALGFVLVFLQPAALAALTCVDLGGPAGGGFGAIVLFVVACVVVIHHFVCLALDAPLSRWLRVTVIEVGAPSTPAKKSARGAICASVFRFFTPVAESSNDATLYGSTARLVVYFSALTVSALVTAWVAIGRIEDAGSSLNAESADWTRRVGVAWLAYLGVTALGLVVALALGSFSTEGHVGSIWCLFANTATVAVGLVLRLHEPVGVSAVFVGAVVGVWAATFFVVSLI